MLPAGQKRHIRGAKRPVAISCMLGCDLQVVQLRKDVLACELEIAGVVDFRPWQAPGRGRANVNALVCQLLDGRIEEIVHAARFNQSLDITEESAVSRSG